MQPTILLTKNGRGSGDITMSSTKEESMPMEEAEVVVAILPKVVQQETR